MIGQILLGFGFVAAVLAVIIGAWDTYKRQRTIYQTVAIYAHSGAVILSSLYLLYALLNHQFQFHYVYANTDSTLSWPFLISAFWAGQQGSFLFWALCGALVGLWVMKRTSKEQAGIVMSILALAQAFLLLFLLQDSPFRLMKAVPIEGKGLNSLLLNPWMIIHPPIIFIAYALLIVPMAYAVRALVSKEYYEAMGESLPWAILGWLFLGAGILIGGVWAYQVLGWGGYWAWDPVENSSLIPWLTCGALVHGLLMKRKRGIFMRANLFLAVTTYPLVILATYITRSGLMADFSVHAFAQTQTSRWIGLFALSFALLGYGLFALRYRDIGEEQEKMTFFTLSLGFALTMLTLTAIAILVLLGTLAPIITGFFGLPATVDTIFYVRTNAPLATGLLLLLGLIPVLGPSKLTWSGLQEQLPWPLAGFSVAMVASFLLGVKNPLHLIYLGAGSFALVGNVEPLWKSLKSRGVRYTGGYLAHIGLALILIGFMVSTTFTKAETVYLSTQKPTQAFGHEFTWSGENKGGALPIQISGRGMATTVYPKMYETGTDLLREPGIRRSWLQDIYLSPLELIAEFPGQILLQEGRFYSYGEHSIQLSELRQGSNHGDGGYVDITAVMVVRYVGDVQSISTKLAFDGNQYEYTGASLPHSDVSVFLQAVDPGRGLAWFTIGDKPAPRQEQLVAEVKTKPLVSFLALGAVLLTLGTAIAWFRRLSRG